MRKPWPARTGEGGTFLSVTCSYATPQHLHHQSPQLCLLPTVPTALNHFHWVWLLLLRASFRWARKVNCQLMGENPRHSGRFCGTLQRPECIGIQLTFCFYIVWGCKDSPTCNLRFGQAQDTIPTLCKLYLGNPKRCNSFMGETKEVLQGEENKEEETQRKFKLLRYWDCV